MTMKYEFENSQKEMLIEHLPLLMQNGKLIVRCG